ncbi:MAG: hypothetical protein IPM46_10755 [Flavobacteriales bacterium]|nr:hypothetical protein [Flavobacteriales bacterium]
MKNELNKLAAVGLAIGVAFGIAGGAFSDPIQQGIVYEISSLGLTAALALLAVKHMQSSQDLAAAGFIVFAIAEGVMTAGSPAGGQVAMSSFGAGMALYLPALLLIIAKPCFPVWTRITGAAATVPFGIAAAQIFLGHEVSSADALPGAGYGLLSLTMIGWIIALLRE